MDDSRHIAAADAGRHIAAARKASIATLQARLKDDHDNGHDKGDDYENMDERVSTLFDELKDVALHCPAVFVNTPTVFVISIAFRSDDPWGRT